MNQQQVLDRIRRAQKQEKKTPALAGHNRKNLASAVAIHAASAMPSSLVSAPPKPKKDPLLALHSTHTSDVAACIVRDGGRINSSQDALPFGDNEGYETIILHGWTATPNKKTFVRTYRDGTKTVQTELLKST